MPELSQGLPRVHGLVLHYTLPEIRRGNLKNCARGRMELSNFFRRDPGRGRLGPSASGVRPPYCPEVGPRSCRDTDSWRRWLCSIERHTMAIPTVPFEGEQLLAGPRLPHLPVHQGVCTGAQFNLRIWWPSNVATAFVLPAASRNSTS